MSDNIINLDTFRQAKKAVLPDFSLNDSELDCQDTKLHQFLMLYIFNGTPRSLTIYAEDILEANRMIEAIKHSAYYGGEMVKEIS